jgi:hypothetical protein
MSEVQILDQHREVIARQGNNKILVRQYAVLKGDHVEIQTIFEEKCNDGKDSHKQKPIILRVPAGKAENPFLLKEWNELLTRIEMYRQTAESYVAYKNHGKPDRETEYNLVANIIHENAADLVRDTMTHEECHRSLRAGVNAWSRLRRFDVDKVEADMLMAGEALKRIKEVMQRVQGDEEDQPWQSGTSYEATPEELNSRFQTLNSAVWETLDQADRLWWRNLQSAYEMMPVPAQERLRLVENYRRALAVAHQSYQELYERMGSSTEWHEELEELENIVQSGIGGSGKGLLPALSRISKIIEREDVLAKTMNEGRLRQKGGRE